MVQTDRVLDTVREMAGPALQARSKIDPPGFLDPNQGLSDPPGTRPRSSSFSR